ncbi:ion transporter [Ruegeria sp. 2012CJ41-6]|uniref:Ion transporter n=1 Tax=Ruegeria spongiae TaxID=2942209 RepID=A0ABT0Q0Z8_9RHOB|nr:ion transporter [Ruegeria spongiae]MCL6283462.1 ion transporter [Ruegeria spongiae]
MGFRERLGAFVDHARFGQFITGVIIVNAVLLGMETSPALMDRFGHAIQGLDRLCLAIFVIEITMKLISRGHRFFLNGWNVFDFLVVGIALAPATEGLSVLRALRILRVLRVISVAPSLRRVVEGFITALPGMGSVFVLMAIIFYIGAVISTKLFGGSFPDWFGDLGLSAYTLFQIMTLESWSMGIVRPVMEAYPYAWVFFVPFIMVTTFAVVNLLVGLIVNSMQDAHHAEDEVKTDAYRDEVLMRLEAIEARIAQQFTTKK